MTVERGKRTALITGASSGIGLETAKELATRNWRLVGTGRDKERLAAAQKAIVASSADVEVEMLTADLSRMAEAVQLAEHIKDRYGRLDLLINNAGGMTDRLVMTDEGLEENFAGNHLGSFVLTHHLVPMLKETARDQPHGTVRILMTASDASEMIPSINLDDPQNLGRFSPGLAYCTSKLANVLFAKGLATRLEGTGIVAHSIAPGAVASNFYTSAPAQTREAMASRAMATPAEGADTLVWLTDCEEARECSGVYWERRAVRSPNPVADDPMIVERLWRRSAELVSRWL